MHRLLLLVVWCHARRLRWLVILLSKLCILWHIDDSLAGAFSLEGQGEPDIVWLESTRGDLENNVYLLTCSCRKDLKDKFRKWIWVDLILNDLIWCDSKNLINYADAFLSERLANDLFVQHEELLE